MKRCQVLQQQDRKNLGPEESGPRLNFSICDKSSVAITMIAMVIAISAIVMVTAFAFNSPCAVLISQVKRTQVWSGIEAEE
jgi:hypothetical protein